MQKINQTRLNSLISDCLERLVYVVYGLSDKGKLKHVKKLLCNLKEMRDIVDSEQVGIPQNKAGGLLN